MFSQMLSLVVKDGIPTVTRHATSFKITMSEDAGIKKTISRLHRDPYDH